MSLLSLIGPITNLLDKVIPDADKKAKIAHEVATLATNHAHELALKQLEINKAEAASNSWFKGGWRPAVGWTCALAFAWHFIGQPITEFGMALAGKPLPPMPDFDMDHLLTVLGGLLGLGTLRTVEKSPALVTKISNMVTKK